MDTIIKKILLVALVLFCSNALSYAQKLGIKIEVSENAKAVVYDGYYHALAVSGAVATYKLTVDDLPEGDILDDDHVIQIKSTPELKPKGSFADELTFERPLTETDRDLDFHVEVTYLDSKKEPKTLKEDAKPIKVYKEPTFEIENNEKKYEMVARNISVNPSYGNPTGWTYKIDNGEESSTMPTSISKPSVGIPGTVHTVIEANNYAPDGTTVWNTFTETIDTYFYDEPAINIAQSSTKETNFYKSTEKNEWTVETKGGGNWTVTWIGGELSQNTSSLTYQAFPSEVSATKENCNIVANYVSTADDGHVLANSSLNVATINVYKKIDTSNLNGSKDLSLYKGESYTCLSPSDNVEDGMPGAWEYKWIDGSGNKSLTVEPTEDKTYTLDAKYKYNGAVWDQYRYEYSVNVYPVPSLTTSMSSNVYDYDKEDNIDKEFKGETVNLQNKRNTAQTIKVIEGDVVKLSFTPEGGTRNWIVKANGQDITSQGFYEYTAATGNSKEVKFEIENNAANLQNPFKATITHNFNVIPKPEIGDNISEIHSYSGQILTLGNNVIGGDNEGWEYEWTNSGTETSSSYTVKSVSKKTVDQISCTASYWCEGVKRYSKKQDYNIIAWPEPKLKGLTVKLRDKAINTVKDYKYFDLMETPEEESYDIECFDGDVLDIAYTVHGGYTGQENCWLYNDSHSMVYNIDAAIVAPGKDDYTASSPVSASTTKSVTLNFKNIPSESVTSQSKKWFDKTITLNVTAWRNGAIAENLTDSMSNKAWGVNNRNDVYAGGKKENDVNFSIQKSYGSENWEFLWKEDGKECAKTADYTYVPKTSSTYTDKTFTVDVTNHIGPNYSLIEKREYNVRVWHKAVLPSDFGIKDVNRNTYVTNTDNAIREGNTIDYYIEPLSYGYRGDYGISDAYYFYDWNSTIPDVNTYSWSETASTVSGQSKNVKEIERVCTVRNYGPYDKVWDGTTISHTFKVYKRPVTPKSLMVKGTGASGTMICTTDISDQDLEGHEYYLVFGYIDSNGNRVDMASKRQQNVGQVRWDESFTPSQVNLPASLLYVYALWKYEEVDGKVSEVTSGIRYADGRLDDFWDSSAYYLPAASTRSGGDEVNGIDNVVFDGKSNITNVYSLDGVMTNQMHKGINILRMSDGTYRKVLKK